MEKIAQQKDDKVTQEANFIRKANKGILGMAGGVYGGAIGAALGIDSKNMALYTGLGVGLGAGLGLLAGKPLGDIAANDYERKQRANLRLSQMK